MASSFDGQGISAWAAWIARTAALEGGGFGSALESGSKLPHCKTDHDPPGLFQYGVRRLAAALHRVTPARSQSGSKLPHSKLAVVTNRLCGKDGIPAVFP